MQINTKRTDVEDIKDIIKKLDAKEVLVTATSIAEQFGQTPANVHRILKLFEIDLRPYQHKHRAKIKVERFNNIVEDQAAIIAKLHSTETVKYTLQELVNLMDFKGNVRQLKSIMVREKLIYKTKSWFAQHLKKMDTQCKSLRELFKECNLDENEVSFATFRTRLYENAIPYQQIIFRKNWWQRLQDLDKQIPQDAIDELHAYFKTYNVKTTDYTTKELYGYFDFDMPYLAFKHLIISQKIRTKKISK